MFEFGIYIKGEMKFQIKRAAQGTTKFPSFLFYFLLYFTLS